MNQDFLNKSIKVFLLLSVSAYSVFKSLTMGDDINFYLKASKQIFDGTNSNIYEYYLYSPFFAVLLRPLSVFNFNIARIIWGFINLFAVYGLWQILSVLSDKALILSKKSKQIWMLGVIIISAGFINHNLILGQITIIILWLAFEGLYQIIYKERNFYGAFLLALGINIKLLPLLGLYYLFLKKKFKALGFSIFFIVLFLFLPSIFIGYNYNNYLLHKWKDTVIPVGDSRYVFEDNNGTQSLNAILPAFFYDFNKNNKTTNASNRLIVSVPHDTLVLILQTVRLLLLLFFLLFIFYKPNKQKNKPLDFFREFSALALITVLIFPHQQKYAMLFSVPAGSYLLLFALLSLKSNYKLNTLQKIIALTSTTVLFISVIGVRDIVGSAVSDFFDYYHRFGLVNIILLLFLYGIKPGLLYKLNANIKHKK